MLLVHNVTDPDSRYSQFLREILILEGFIDVEQLEAADLPARLAAGSDETVLLPRMNLPAATGDALLAHVRQGGRLVALHPDPFLLQKLGVTPSYSAIRRGLLTFAGSDLLAGLPLDPVQIVVPAVRGSAPAGAQALAVVTDTDDPFVRTAGILHLTYGDGEAVIFAFDLAKAVARLRFGNPDLENVFTRANDNILRPHELLIGMLDPRQMQTAQTDILTAVLGRVIETFAPQPRVWYYPDPDQRSALLQTSDDDWSTIEQFEHMLGTLKQYEATCTYYIVPNSHVTTRDMDRWEQAGHVFSVHPATDNEAHRRPAPPEPQVLWVPEMVRENVERHRQHYGRPVNTVRNHCVRWARYLELPRLHAALGVRAEANYMCVPPFPVGFLCGSGRLLPFVEESGEIIDHYQIPSAWTEEALINPTHSASMNWMLGRAQNETSTIIRRAATRYFTPVTLNSHPVSFATYSQPLIEDNWRTARELSVPIVSADSWTAWTDGRRALALDRGDGGWTVRAEQSLPSVTVLFPAGASATAAGSSVTRQQIWGRSYEALRLTNLTAGEQRRIEATLPAVAGAAG